MLESTSLIGGSVLCESSPRLTPTVVGHKMASEYKYEIGRLTLPLLIYSLSGKHGSKEPRCTDA